MTGRNGTGGGPDLTYDQRQDIFDRDGRRCLKCGSREVTMQHRRAKGMGGLGKKHPKLTCADGVALCGVHNTEAEGSGQAEALRFGWKIPRLCPVASSNIPYFDMLTRTWWLPDDTGRRKAVDGAWAADRIKSVNRK